MENKITSRLDKAANISIIAVALLLSVILVKNYLLNNRGGAPRGVAVGQKLELTIPTNEGPTLVLALSTTCHFCTESAPFYRRLLEEPSAKRTQFLAVFPQPKSEATEYLGRLGLPISNIQQVDFRAMGVVATPTVILANEKGVATAVWVGRLTPVQEKDLLAKLH